MAVSKERKAELIKQYGKDEKDSGSAPVQVALLTERIRELTEHMKSHHRTDFHHPDQANHGWGYTGDLCGSLPGFTGFRRAVNGGYQVAPGSGTQLDLVVSKGLGY